MAIGTSSGSFSRRAIMRSRMKVCLGEAVFRPSSKMMLRAPLVWYLGILVTTSETGASTGGAALIAALVDLDQMWWKRSNRAIGLVKETSVTRAQTIRINRKGREGRKGSQARNLESWFLRAYLLDILPRMT